MSALVPYNYHGYPSPNYLDSSRQKRTYYYDKDFPRQAPIFPPFYPIPSYYQTSFFPTAAYPTANYNHYQPPGINSTALVQLNQDDNRYHAQNTWPNVNKMQKRPWKHHDSALPFSTYSSSYRTNYNPNKVYQYEKEIRYFPYPVFANRGSGGLGTGGNLKYDPFTTFQYPALSRFDFPNNRNANSLPPKIRVIFIPPSSPCAQNPCSGSLAMPPFLFSRMTQPLCALPLPPPLPQISSLPLTPALQQQVMQQYANPIAVLPFSSCCQQSQPFMSSYPPVFQQQQQPMMPMPAFPQQSMLPMPALQQPFMMSMPALQQQPMMSMPALQQPFMMSMPALQQQPMMSMPALSQQPIMPMSALQSPQYFSQPFVSPSLPQANMSMLPLSVSNPASSVLPYVDRSFPSTCRACIPPPPPLNVAVRDHRWMQHCSACHHVPADASRPNVRPSDGRMTPLLRRPTVMQYVPDRKIQQYQYPHMRAHATMTSWSRNMPPLPRGAVIISDQYITKSDLAGARHYSQNYPIQHPRVCNSAVPSGKMPTYSINKTRRHKAVLLKPGYKYQQYYNTSQSRGTSNSIKTSPPQLPPSNTNYSPTSSVSAPSTDTSPQKPDIHRHNNDRNLAHKQLSAMARMINLRYNQQTPDLQAAYHLNESSKSSDDDAISIASSIASSNIFSTKRTNSPGRPLSTTLNALQEEGESEQEGEEEKSTRPRSSASFHSEQSKQRVIVIHQLRKPSPSSNTANSGVPPSTIATNDDRRSTSSTATVQQNKTN